MSYEERRRSSTIPGKVWKYVHTEDVWIQTNILGRSFSGEWLDISALGRITVKGSHARGYAWDGCSPKYEALDMLLGTPDGKLDYSTAKPITYYASMIHDALYQYKKEVPVSRQDADIIFQLILKQSGFMWWWLYGAIVQALGGFYGDWKVYSDTPGIEITECSWWKEAEEV